MESFRNEKISFHANHLASWFSILKKKKQKKIHKKLLQGKETITINCRNVPKKDIIRFRTPIWRQIQRY